MKQGWRPASPIFTVVPNVAERPLPARIADAVPRLPAEAVLAQRVGLAAAAGGAVPAGVAPGCSLG